MAQSRGKVATGVDVDFKVLPARSGKGLRDFFPQREDTRPQQAYRAHPSQRFEIRPSSIFKEHDSVHPSSPFTKEFAEGRQKACHNLGRWRCHAADD
jgi:hypothetical protein